MRPCSPTFSQTRFTASPLETFISATKAYLPLTLYGLALGRLHTKWVWTPHQSTRFHTVCFVREFLYHVGIGLNISLLDPFHCQLLSPSCGSLFSPATSIPTNIYLVHSTPPPRHASYHYHPPYAACSPPPSLSTRPSMGALGSLYWNWKGRNCRMDFAAANIGGCCWAD